MKEKSQDKRDAILQAAFQVVCTKGYYETRIDDVARKAGVAKGTVYLYFRDKPDLYIGMLRWLIDEARGILDAVGVQGRAASEKLQRVFERWFENLIQRPAAIDLMFPEMQKERCEIARRFHEQVLPEVRKLLDGIGGLIEEGIRRGEFRPVDPRLAALSFLNAFRAALLIASSRLGVKTAPESALEIFFYGIRR